MLYIDFGVEMANGLNGVGLRAVELAQAFASHTDVTVLSPDTPDPEITTIWPGPRYQQASLAVPARGDVYWYGFATPPDTVARVRATGAACVFDAIVWPLEFLTYENVRTANDSGRAYQQRLGGYLRQLRMADKYTVASSVERHVVTAMLSTAFWSPLHQLAPALDDQFFELPVGMSAINEHTYAAPSPATSTDLVLVWNGGTWNHYDPAAAVTAVAALSRDGVPVQLWFLYPQRGTPTASLQAARAAAAGSDAIRFARTNLGLTDRVAALRHATAAICVYPPHALWDLCPPMRLRETLIYQLPIIAPRRGALGDLITEHGFGVTINGHGDAPLRDAIVALADPAQRDSMRHAAAQAAPAYQYETHAAAAWKWIQSEPGQ